MRCCIDCSLVHEIFKVCTGKSCCCARNCLKVNIIAKLLISAVNLQDFLTSLHIRSANDNLAVKTSGTQNCRIKYIDSVRCSHDDNSFIDAKSIHLDKKLVECLLSLVMSSAHSCASSSCNSINLINKYDTWCVLFAIFKEVTHSGCTYTDEHLNKV